MMTQELMRTEGVSAAFALVQLGSRELSSPQVLNVRYIDGKCKKFTSENDLKKGATIIIYDLLIINSLFSFFCFYCFSYFYFHFVFFSVRQQRSEKTVLSAKVEDKKPRLVYF